MLDTGNTAWILTSTALVLFMTLPGLALFYAGLVKSKNILSVLMQCIAIACLASLIWLGVGYSMAFSDGSPWVGGFKKPFFQVLKGTPFPVIFQKQYFLCFR